MGRRPKQIDDSGLGLFDRPGTRRQPTPGCGGCGGDGWRLGADGEPVEPAERCECTEPAHV